MVKRAGNGNSEKKSRNPRWQVGARHQGEPLARFITDRLAEDEQGFSLRLIKTLMEQGRCQVDGELERFASRKLRTGEVVTMQLPAAGERVRLRSVEVSPKSVLWRDEELVIIDKPAGLSTTKSGKKSLPEELVELARQLGLRQLLPAHRLDRDTSGALILAASGPARDSMAALFKERKILKAYEALVHGRMEKDEGRFHSQMARLAEEGGQVRWGSVRSGGLEAITDYKVLACDGKKSWLRLFPKTGRTHQLRVHLSESGHPIIGDPIYGRGLVPENAPQAARHLLHARGLVFPHPKTGKQIAVEAPLPKDFLELAPN